MLFAVYPLDGKVHEGVIILKSAPAVPKHSSVIVGLARYEGRRMSSKATSSTHKYTITGDKKILYKLTQLQDLREKFVSVQNASTRSTSKKTNNITERSIAFAI